VRVALPYFRLGKTDCEGHRSATSFHSANGLPAEEDALAEVDAEELVVSGGDGPTIGGRGETEGMLPSGVSDDALTALQRRRAPWTIISVL
jgi:hypothetical protein